VALRRRRSFASTFCSSGGELALLDDLYEILPFSTASLANDRSPRLVAHPQRGPLELKAFEVVLSAAAGVEATLARELAP
jgi:hypothetical protein